MMIYTAETMKMYFILLISKEIYYSLLKIMFAHIFKICQNIKDTVQKIQHVFGILICIHQFYIKVNIMFKFLIQFIN